MLSTSENLITMAVATSKVCYTFESVWTPSATFTSAVTELDSEISEVQLFQQLQSQSTKGLTIVKKEIRLTSAVAAVIIAQGIVNYAYDKKLTDLLSNATISKTKINKGRDSKALDTLKYLLALAQDNVAALKDYGITDTQVTDFESLIGKYELAIPAPRVLRVKIKNATSQIKVVCKSISETLKFRLDAGMEQFRISHPDFYNEYFNARIIIDLKGPSTGIKGNVEDKVSTLKLRNAKITLVEIDSTRKSTKTGHYSFKKLEPGIYTMKVEVEGYEDLIINNITVNAGYLTALNLQMNKIEMQTNLAA
ncbi:MAG: carboxypeptidase-like regulatory domain-containing protein [Bacteroidia bacterium]